MYQIKTNFINHVKMHATIYLFMLILFLTGVVFGAIIVNSMGFAQRKDLFFYLEQFFGQLSVQDQISAVDIWKDSLYYHAKYLVLLFVLGLSVIGLPLVWILLFLKGLVVGFSVGFIVNQLGMQGFMLASLSIAPQNILIIPIYIIAGSLSMIFSLTLLHKLFTTKISQPIMQPFGKYIALFALLAAVSVIAAGIEAFVSSKAMEAVVKSIYK